MNEKLKLFKLLVHWILCQMLSDIAVVRSSSGGIFNDLTTGKWTYSLILFPAGPRRRFLAYTNWVVDFDDSIFICCFYLLALIGFYLPVFWLWPQNDCKISIARLCDILNCWNRSEMLLNFPFSLGTFVPVHPLNDLFPLGDVSMMIYGHHSSSLLRGRFTIMQDEYHHKTDRKNDILFDLHVVLMDLDWFRLTLIMWLFCIGHMKSFSSHRRTFPLNLNHKYFIQWNYSPSPSVIWSTFSNQILCTTCSLPKAVRIQSWQTSTKLQIKKS